jgi:A/G-specific adenine glycosylase
MKKFSNQLIQWYLINKRELPWRKVSNPYYIWLSEIILQQTRVDQGLSYYLKFIEQFPTVKNLAEASEEEVLKLWQGLGYYSRARNLHYSAIYIVNELNGKFPSNYIDLLNLKGVGDYTASAIASICYNEPTAVVDGNVYRVLARYFGIETAINSIKGRKEFKLLAQELIDDDNPGTHNQAVMEFGARMCKPQNPDCLSCPLKESCVSLQKNKVNLLPFKEKKLKVRNRFFNYLVIITKSGKTKIEKRISGIWRNMYQFPLIESEKEMSVEELIGNSEFELLFKDLKTTIKLNNKNMIIHKLSHQHIYAKFWIIETANHHEFDVEWSSIFDKPVPKLIANFLDSFNFN